MVHVGASGGATGGAGGWQRCIFPARTALLPRFPRGARRPPRRISREIARRSSQSGSAVALRRRLRVARYDREPALAAPTVRTNRAHAAKIVSSWPGAVGHRWEYSVPLRHAERAGVAGAGGAGAGSRAPPRAWPARGRARAPHHPTRRWVHAAYRTQRKAHTAHTACAANDAVRRN